MLNNQRKMPTKEVVKRLFSIAFIYKRSIFLSIPLMIVFSLINAIPAVYIKNIIDALQSGQKYPLSRFVLIGGAIVGIILVKSIIGYLQDKILGYLGAKITTSMRGIVYQKILYLPLSFFNEVKTGDIFNRISGDLGQLQTFILTILRSYILQIPQIIVLVSLMLYRSWILGLTVLIILPLLVYAIKKFSLKIKSIVETDRKQSDRLFSHILESIRGIRVVKSFTTENLEYQKFNTRNQDLLKTAKKNIRTSAAAIPVIELLNSFFLAFVVILGGWLINNSTLTGGDIASFLLASTLAYAPVKSLNGINLVIQASLISARRLFEILDIPNPIIESSSNKKKLAPFKKEIEIKIKSFNYDKKKNKILQNIKLTIPKGNIIALVGKTGSGKTTIANLLPRFYDLEKDEGFIKIDGVNIREISLSSLRQQISIVSQETLLFNDTIENNITYGQKKYTQKDLEKIAKQTHIDEFIKNLTNGYQEEIGEGGVKLSGGQRQRINLARACMKKAPILIFDEPTNSLDSESEQKIFNYIEPLIKKSTVIMIAHRLSTIQKADTIYVLKNGKIIESGNHKDLLAYKKEYYKLCQIQSTK